MKKFIWMTTGILLCLSGFYYAIYYNGFYIDFHPNAEVEVMVKIEGKQIFLTDQKKDRKPFFIRGVDLPSDIPGYFSTDYAVDETTWMRWFELIQEMGANTIRIYTIYNDVFYRAFYEFNSKKEEPLYLLQGLEVSDYANHSSEDAYGKEFYSALKKDSLDVIDVLHGRKNIPINRRKGSGIYRKDVSPWVLGYVLGNEWDASTIAYTNYNKKNPSDYSGRYFYTTKEATAFEVMLAKILDDMAIYESEKYKTQKLYSFLNDPKNDPFIYEKHYAKQLGKFNCMDAEHIFVTEQLKSGYFASYQLYEFCEGFADYFSSEQKKELQNILSVQNTSLYLEGYTKLLSEYHTMPVVITGYGFSTSRGTDREGGPLTERQQGERLVSAYQDIMLSGCNGACISTWQDVWGRRTWNTSYALDLNHAERWHDIQTDGQGYGLLSFDPGKKESICYIDGDRSEWSKEDAIFYENEIGLSVKADERCLYLLIEKDGLSEQTELFVPFDITPKSGSEKSANFNLYFERAADFLLCLKGKENSRLLVQTRYEALRENYLMETQGDDPFVFFPKIDDPEFVPIRMVLKKDQVVKEDATEEELLKAKRFNTIETGKLTYGNGNPTSEAYNSLADFCYGENCVEIRIPWQLLNFSDPSDLKIHDDYYEHYGVEWFPIHEIYLGVGLTDGSQRIPMRVYKLNSWRERVTFHERLKQSYEIIQKYWRGSGKDVF